MQTRDPLMLDPHTQDLYRQLATWMARRTRKGAQCPVFGINGAQGSGKSTAAAFLQSTLLHDHALRAVVLSLDDFYLTRIEREALAADVHPLLATRGVPGTHETALGIRTVELLRSLAPGQQLALPRFSKALDDRLPEKEGSMAEGPIDLILFEGWCVGLTPQAGSELVAPLNALEAQEDRDGRWRGYVNHRLGQDYADWFSLLDALLFLRVPDFECVLRWRSQQEAETARDARAGPNAGLQTPQQLGRFIQHYERLTRHALATLPAAADVVMTLRRDHVVEQIRFGQPD